MLEVQLLGDVRVCRDGLETRIRSRKLQLLLARLALGAPPADDAALARDIGVSLSYLRVLRSRAIREGSPLRGCFVRRWELRDVRLDVTRAHELAHRVLTATSDSGVSEEERTEAVAIVKLGLLPMVGDRDAPDWLADERQRLHVLREKLLGGATKAGFDELDAGDVLELREPRLPIEPLDNLWRAVTKRDEPFVREREVESVRTHFTRIAVRPVVLSGDPGQGKSTVAHAFAAAERNYRVKWWIDASSGIALRDGLRTLSRALAIPSVDRDPWRETDDRPLFLDELRRLIADLAIDDRLLLVFDGLDEPGLRASLEKLLDYILGPQVHLLITTTLTDWGPRFDEIRMGPVSEDHAFVLPGEPDEQRRILGKLDGRPLLLSLVSGQEQPVHPDDTSGRRSAVVGPDLHAPWADIAIRQAIEAASAEGPEVEATLRTLAYCAPQPLPAELVAAGEAVGALERHGLLRIVERGQPHEERAYVVHGFIQEVLQADDEPMQADDERRVEHVERAVALFEKRWSDSDAVESGGAQTKLESISAHLDVVCDHALELRAIPEQRERIERVRAEAAQLSSLLGRLRRRHGEWDAAEHAFRRAVELASAAAASGDHRTGLYSVRLANLLRQRRRYDEATALLAAAIPLVQHEDVDLADRAWALTVKARTLRAQPRSAPFDALEPLVTARDMLADGRGLWDRRRTEEEAHLRQSSEIQAELAALYRQLARYADAREAAEIGLQLLADSEEDWAERVRWRHERALGNIDRIQGRLGAAVVHHEQAVTIVSRQYGADHPLLVRCLDSLGRAQREYGDFSTARKTFEDALKLCVYRFGEKSEHTATAQINLALTHANLGDPEEALRFADAGFSTFKALYGDPVEADGHGTLISDQTAWALYVRADILRQQWRELEAAERCHQVVRDLRLERYGPEHPHVASSLYALGQCASHDRPDEALVLHGEALRIRQIAFHPPNFWIAQSQARVGELLGADGLAYLEAALTTFEAQLKPGHWRTEGVRAVLRSRARGDDSASPEP